jgi:PIN domain nuclease of toxin-antitoxin system
VRVLLDTHIAVWAAAAPDRLSTPARKILEDPTAELFFSHVSLWEIAVKVARGRRKQIDLPNSSADARKAWTEMGFLPLAIAVEHIERVETLSAEHGDPFDRLLAAQALTEPMRLLTHDRKMLLINSDAWIA